MKLRFRPNSLRLRVNRREVDQLRQGRGLAEEIHFPGDRRMSYVLEASPSSDAAATFEQDTIRVLAPHSQVTEWAEGDEIGLYYDLPANGVALRVAIEKDLECTDGPAEERDPEAYPRKTC